MEKTSISTQENVIILNLVYERTIGSVTEYKYVYLLSADHKTYSIFYTEVRVHGDNMEHIITGTLGKENFEDEDKYNIGMTVDEYVRNFRFRTLDLQFVQKAVMEEEIYFLVKVHIQQTPRYSYWEYILARRTVDSDKLELISFVNGLN